MPVLDPGRGRTKSGCLWAYARDDRPWAGPLPPAVAYVYTENRREAYPADHLTGFTGILQVDGYAGFKRLTGDRKAGPITLVFCWAHTRRKFYEIHQATGSPIAGAVLRYIAELYRIEADIRGHPSAHRRAVRQEKSAPVVAALKAYLDEQLACISGKSGLAEAIRYARNHWDGLVRFLDDGRQALGRVDDWRGGVRAGELPLAGGGIASTGASVPAGAPFPVAARQTGRADFPHPAFSWSIMPSRSAGRRGGEECGRG